MMSMGCVPFRHRHAPHVVTHHRSPQQYGSEDLTATTTNEGPPWFTTPCV